MSTRSRQNCVTLAVPALFSSAKTTLSAAAHRSRSRPLMHIPERQRSRLRRKFRLRIGDVDATAHDRQDFNEGIYLQTVKD